MHDDLSKVTDLIDLSKKTMAVVRESVTTAILIKAVFCGARLFRESSPSGLPMESVTWDLASPSSLTRYESVAGDNSLSVVF
jgi:cation transport ATPase